MNLNPFKNPESNIKIRIKKDTHDFLEDIFKENQDPEKRIAEILNRLGFLERLVSREILSEAIIEKVRGGLKDSVNIADKKTFINRVSKVLEPILELRNKYPLEFENAQATMSNERLGYVELNRFVTYEIIGDVIHLHHSEAQIFIKKEGPNISLYKDAMFKLAKILEDDPSIKKVEATSWIVYKMQKTFKRYGFIVEEIPQNISSMQRISGNQNDLSNKQVATATISREKFLEVFGNK